MGAHALPSFVPQTFNDFAFVAIELVMAAWIWGMCWAFGPGGDERLKAWEAKRAAKKNRDQST